MARLAHLYVLIRREYNERNLSFFVSLAGEHNSSLIVNAAQLSGIAFGSMISLGERQAKRDDIRGKS